MERHSEADIHALWQQQPVEPQPLSLEAIRAKARRFDTTTRRWRNAGTASFSVLLIANIVEVLWPGQGLVERTGDLLTIAALAFIAYEFRKHARFRPERLGRTSCIDFYRAQLVHEQTLARQSRRYLLPFVPGVTLSLLGNVLDHGLPISRKIAVAVLGVALFAGAAWLNARTARRLQREIETLEPI